MSPDDLLNRVSVSARRLVPPGPTLAEIDTIVRAALTAPDHGGLRPWRFIHIGDADRPALADLFASVSDRDPGRARDKAMHAPCLLAVVARLQPDHTAVPLREQYASVGAAIAHLLLAANALGYGAIMLSGERTRAPQLLSALGLTGNEELMGFASIGTPSETPKPKTRPPLSDHLTGWTPPS